MYWRRLCRRQIPFSARLQQHKTDRIVPPKPKFRPSVSDLLYRSGRSDRSSGARLSQATTAELASEAQRGAESDGLRPVAPELADRARARPPPEP